MTNATQERKEHFLARFDAFAKSVSGQEPGWLQEIRKQAIAHFQEIGFPTLRDEDWRETNALKIVEQELAGAKPEWVRDEDVDLAKIPGFDGPTLVFANGVFCQTRSSIGSLPEGVRVASLSSALKNDAASLEPYFAKMGSYENHPFAALNTALMQDGAFISVPKGVAVETPIHVIFATNSGGSPVIACPRLLVVAGDGSAVKIIESHVGPKGDAYLSNSVSEFVCGDNSNVQHCKIQNDSASANHIAKIHTVIGDNAHFASHSLSFGAALARNDIHGELSGEGIECVLNGLCLLQGKQHHDNRLTVEHTKPNCVSHELYKGVLDDQSRAVFRGRIHVHQDAQKTDAYQTNNSLLLSDDAEVNTRPQLEIYADDVKCSHGATIGQLEQDSIFYFQSRGIKKETAKSLLLYAFASEIIEQIGIEETHSVLRQSIIERLPDRHLFED